LPEVVVMSDSLLWTIWSFLIGRVSRSELKEYWRGTEAGSCVVSERNVYAGYGPEAHFRCQTPFGGGRGRGKGAEPASLKVAKKRRVKDCAAGAASEKYIYIYIHKVPA
jgi:hypothetical protein